MAIHQPLVLRLAAVLLLFWLALGAVAAPAAACCATQEPCCVGDAQDRGCTACSVIAVLAPDGVAASEPRPAEPVSCAAVQPASVAARPPWKPPDWP